MLDFGIFLRSVLPLFLLIGLGFLSRKAGVLRGGDERVLNTYLYYFALPALFMINLSEQRFSTKAIDFIVGSILPVLVALVIYAVLLAVFRKSKNTIYLSTLCTVFGSTVFFGIPFITFAFPTREAEYLATLSAASIGIVAVPVSITILEFYRFEHASMRDRMKQVACKLLRNPLIISILVGILLSTVGVTVPSAVASALHMLGSSTSVVAIFMLGVFLYGRKYANIFQAFGLSLLRIALLPAIAFFVALLFNLSNLERAVIVLMHGTPLAVSMIVLSERYEFYKQTIASLILISSVAASLSMSIWLLLLG